MSLQHLVSVLAGVDAAEAARLLEAELTRRGQRVLERLAHPRGEVFPELTERLARHPGAQAFTFYEPPPLAVAPPSTIMHQRSTVDAGWDPMLVRALSAGSGGFALAMHARRSREEYGLAVFYAGHTLESTAAFADEAATWAALSTHYRTVTGGSDSDLRWSEGVEPRSWIVEASPAAPVAADAEPPLRRAAFAGVRAEEVRAALADLGSPIGALRLLERHTPVAAIPFVLLDGDLELARFNALAQRLGTHAAAVDLRHPAEITWTRLGPGGPQGVGRDHGAGVLEQVWGALAVTMGEPPAIIRWPGGS
jgi:hypothetical protein